MRLSFKSESPGHAGQTKFSSIRKAMNDMHYFLGRVSSKDQSLARQLKVARERYDIPDENVYCDKMSGSTFEQPQYQKLKQIVQPGDEVIVNEFNWFERNQEEAKKELEWFREHKVIVRILDIPTTLADYPAGSEWVLDMVTNVLIEVLGAVAEQERKNINKRTSGGRAVKSASGGYSGGRTPFGYIAENHQMVIEPEEAEVVREIFRLKDCEGMTYQAVADALNQEGKVNRSGKPFIISTIQTIYENKKVYQGMYRYGKRSNKDAEWVKGQHEPILKE